MRYKTLYDLALTNSLGSVSVILAFIHCTSAPWPSLCSFSAASFPASGP